MTITATENRGISTILAAVPEFEETFQEELAGEEGELGAFQAVSLFARWVSERLRAQQDADAVRRAFAAIEQLIVDQALELGDDLAAEFIEAIANEPAARACMGPMTRRRAARDS